MKKINVMVGALMVVGASMAAEIDLMTAKIVLPEKPNEVQRRAAQELDEHLMRITDGLRIGTGAATFFFAKPEDAPAPKPHEACCRIVGNRVWFWGDDKGLARLWFAKGSLNAVYAFLTKQLGVDWVCPGTRGLVIPRRKTVTLPETWNDSFVPPLLFTEIRAYSDPKPEEILESQGKIPQPFRKTVAEVYANNRDNREWLQRHRIEICEKVGYGHAFNDWEDRFGETHPEYLCQPKADDPKRGIRDPKHGFHYGKLCVSNEGVVDQIVADWVARGKPKFLNICENDGRSYCRCAACCALDCPKEGEDFEAHKTDRYVNFWNRVAAKTRALRPDVMLVSYIYSDYRLPPRREKIAYPENMLFGIVPSLTDDYEADYAAWKKAGMAHFFLRPNFHAYRGVLPRGCEKAIYDNFQCSRRFGIIGVDYDGYMGHYSTDPEYYVTARMVIEPEKSFESIMADYCAAFGEAADVVSAYYARIRERGERKINEIRAARGTTPSDGTYDYRTSLHTLAELEADRDFLTKGLAGKVITSKEAAARVRRLQVQAEHYVRTARLYEAVKVKDTRAMECEGWSLLAFRRQHLKELPDIYDRLFAQTFACGEWWVWRSSYAYRAITGGTHVGEDGPEAGWFCTFETDAGTSEIGWWSKRDAFLACTNGAACLSTQAESPIGINASALLTPGATYRYSADFRAEAPAGKRLSATLRVLFPKGSSGVTTPAAWKAFPDIGEKWCTRSFTFTVPNDVKTAIVYVYAGQTKDAAYRLWCDNVRLERLGNPEAERVQFNLPTAGLCAHRGDHAVFPENTVPAFVSAAQKGAAMVEFDVKRCKTGELVIMHDATVNRTTSGTGTVSSLTFDQIRALDAGIRKGAQFAGTRVPTFDEAIDCLPRSNIWINVHCKDDVTAEVATKIHEKGRLHQAFISARKAGRDAARRVVPGIKTCFMDNPAGSWYHIWTREEMADYFAAAAGEGTTFMQPHYCNFTPAQAAAFNATGGRINYFYLNDPARLQTLCDMGAQFILTDKLDAMMPAWKALRKERVAAVGHWALTDRGCGWIDIAAPETAEKGIAALLWGGGSPVPYAATFKDNTFTATTCNKKHTFTLSGTITGDTMKGARVETVTETGAVYARETFVATRIAEPFWAPEKKWIKFGEPIDLLAGGRDNWELMGKDVLDGWTIKDGVLSNRVKRDENGKVIQRGGNLRTKRADFTDFKVSYDVRVPAGCNSGVYLRGIYELQVLDSYGKKVDCHNMAAPYGRITPSESAEKPAGEWQHVDAFLFERHVTVILNGKKIVNNQPLVGVTGGSLSTDVYAPGPIYLQGDHSDADFRNFILTPIVK